MKKRIHITARKEITEDGKRAYEIVEIYLLSKFKLPRSYLDSGAPVAYSFLDQEEVYETQALILKNRSSTNSKTCLKRVYRVGFVVNKKEFDKLISFLVAAGENLKECNARDRRRANWHGTEEFVI